MTSIKQGVLNVVKAAGTNLTVKQIQDSAPYGVPQSSIRRILGELKSEGLVTRVYAGRMATWQAVTATIPTPVVPDEPNAPDSVFSDDVSNASYETDEFEEGDDDIEDGL